jgi:hypothetical protein
MALPESSPSGPAGPAWTRQKHQEDQEEVADLPRAPEHAGESQSMEIDGDQQRPDVVDDELEDAGVPGTNGEQGELHGGEVKLKKVRQRWEAVCSSLTMTSSLQRISR